MSILTNLIDAQLRDAKNELDGKVLTLPKLRVTDGIGTTYACDVDIGITNNQGNDQSGNLVNANVNGSILHDVAIARGNSEVVYADVGSAVRLRRTASGRYEIIGFSKEMPGTFIRVPIDLSDFTFGPIEDLSVTSRLLTYEELGALPGGYGSPPYDAVGIFVGGILQGIA